MARARRLYPCSWLTIQRATLGPGPAAYDPIRPIFLLGPLAGAAPQRSRPQRRQRLRCEPSRREQRLGRRSVPRLDRHALDDGAQVP